MHSHDGGPITNEVLCAEYEAVYHYVLSLCRSEADAQDITQETLLKAMTATAGFSGSGSLYTWLCAIAKNLWFTRCKRKKREFFPENWDDLPADLSLEQRLDDRDLSLRIHRVLHALPEPYKEVFSLRVFGQLPYADIARLFSKTESWARVTYHRAKKMLLETLGKEGIL